MIKLAFENTYYGYENGLLPRLIDQEAKSPVKVTSAKDCDLLILGPFSSPQKFRLLRRFARPISRRIDSLGGRKNKPLTLFHCGENIRWDAIEADYAISSDLGVTAPKHF